MKKTAYQILHINSLLFERQLSTPRTFEPLAFTDPLDSPIDRFGDQGCRSMACVKQQQSVQADKFFNCDLVEINCYQDATFK